MPKIKLKEHQKAILAETIIYAFGRRIKALSRMGKNPEYREPFPLKKMYSRYKQADRRIILAGLNVWFQQSTRGNSGGPCSTWAVRSASRLDEDILNFLRIMYKRNIEHFTVLKASINAKDKTIVEVTTTFQFDSSNEAKMFFELIDPLLETPETKKGTI